MYPELLRRYRDFVLQDMSQDITSLEDDRSVGMQNLQFAVVVQHNVYISSLPLSLPPSLSMDDVVDRYRSEVIIDGITLGTPIIRVV